MQMAAFRKIFIVVYMIGLIICSAMADIPINHISASPHVAPAQAPEVDSPAPVPVVGADSPRTAPTPGATTASKVFDVTKYGAVADGKTENSLAFLAAWNASCVYAGNSTFLIPEGTFFLGWVTFNGPCYNNKSPNVEIRGVLKAPSSPSNFTAGTWILFRGLNGFNLTGSKTALLDGQGAEAWSHAGCQKSGQCNNLPVSVRFIDISGGMISNISLLNSKSFHITFLGSENILVHGVTITAPWNSPNTDGIHIGNSTNINITSSTIGVGDDCVSIGPGSTNISISNTKCGPGHGISVGSLGKNPNEEDVVGVSVNNCTINGTTNGVRIKTWPGAPASKASNITFQNITMVNVSNPIIIDQEYCPQHSCTSQPSLVKLSDIHFRNIKGTSNTASGVILLCSATVPCENIQILNINLTSVTIDGSSTSTYWNVKGASNGLQILSY